MRSVRMRGVEVKAQERGAGAKYCLLRSGRGNLVKVMGRLVGWGLGELDSVAAACLVYWGCLGREVLKMFDLEA